MRKCWELVQQEFPWISVLPCQPHVASLLLKDVGKIAQFDALIKEEGTIVGWFSNHQKPLAILRKKVAATFGHSKELIKAAATRFGTNTMVGQRLLDLRQALQSTVVDEEYVKQKYKDAEDAVEEGNATRVVRQNKGGTAKALVLDEEKFWPEVKQHVNATEPVYNLLRRHDTSGPSLGKVYHGFYTVGEHLTAVDVPYKEALVDAFDARWAYGHVDIIAAAYALDPEYINHDHASNKEVTEGLLNSVEKIAILYATRELQKENGRFTADWDKRAKLIEGNEEAARQQRREAEARPVRIYDDVPCTDPDMYKCPRCNFHNFYLRTMCNKLRCGNCDKPFCIVCLHPSSTMSHLADHAGCARLFALSR